MVSVSSRGGPSARPVAPVVAEPVPHVNMADVARAAGVSTSTVSRALRDLPGVSPARRDRIRAIAEDLAYVVSPEASGLARGATGRVAVVVPSLSRWYFSVMLAGIEAALRDADLDVLIYHVGDAEDRRRFFHELPARRKVDAVVVIALPVPPKEVERLDLMGVQVVVAGGRMRDYPHVRIDDHAAALLAVRHLVDLGHERVAMIRTSDAEGQLWPTDVSRTLGYLDAIAQARLPTVEEYLVTTPFGIHNGIDAMNKLLALPVPPTAVFAQSDEIAFGALRALHQAGVEVPGDMSIMGVDDHPLAELHDLTTIRQPVELQGRMAGEIVLHLLGDEPRGDSPECVPVELVVRRSTGPPR
jgi:LacI family transcriptional regulator, repressor for deo operon, udp, cdd, tsx, nupC, and nupG